MYRVLEKVESKTNAIYSVPEKVEGKTIAIYSVPEIHVDLL